MSRLNVPRALALYLAWMGVAGGALLAGIGGALPFGLGAVGPDGAFVGLIQAELFFVMVLWPFFMPKLILPAAAAVTRTAGPGAEPHLLFLQVGVLIVVALPLALAGSNLSEIGAGEFVRAQVLVLSIAAFVTALLDRPAPVRVRTWYFLGFFVLAALLPFVGFLAGEWGRGASLTFLAAVSPFWAASQLGPDATLSWAPGVQAALFGVLAVALFAAGGLRRPVDSTPAAP